MEYNARRSTRNPPEKVKIFLSYPSAHKDAAESLCFELQAEGHEVFFDKEDLPPGQSYNERIRSAIEASDLLIFLITPESVAKGKYTLTELKIACKKWPNPTGRVLPVMLEATPFEDMPGYLKAVTVLSPEGNLTAEVVMEVAELARGTTSKPQEPAAVDTDMPSFSYRPVEIRFGEASGSYPVSVTDSPAGTVPAQPCPIDPVSMEQLLWASGGQVQGTVRRARVELGETGESLLPSADDARKVGRALYESLFSSPIRPCLDGSLRSVDRQRGEGLRFLINTTEAPDLARLPWEFLYNPAQDDFLFTDRMKPVIRWLDVDEPPATLVVQPPLRLLMAVASPQDRPELGVGQEIAQLDEALRDLVDEGLVETERLEHATLEKLDDALLQQKPHVLHFIGHGDFAGDEGVIVLEAETPAGAADPITGRRLGVLLRNHPGLRFVFLNSCLGAAVSVKDPFGGVAQSLIQRGIPAVIAMQFPIPDRVAIALARHFYRYLAAGLPVDTALTSARAFLFARGYGVEWGAPALYMRTPDGRLFDVGGRAAVPAPATRQPAPVTAPTPSAPQTEPEASAPLPEPRAERGPARWLWFALALLLGVLGIGAYVFLQSGPEDPITTLPPPPPDPVIVEPAADEAYLDAAAAFADGNPQAGISKLLIARDQDADLQVFEELPAEVRETVIDGLVAIAAAQVPDGDLRLAEEMVEALLVIEPQHGEGLVLQDRIRTLLALPPPPPPPPPPPEQSVEIRTVTRGDSLWAIAGSVYGDPAQWPRIYEANRDRIADPDLIYPDQELVLPTLPLRAVAPPSPGAHRVQAGDTLWDIAGEIYGDPLRWPEIYEANRDQIQNPHLIFPNQVFEVPGE